MKSIVFLLLALMSFSAVFSQNKVSFEVMGDPDEALIGATIGINGTSRGAITDNEGKAQIENIQDGEFRFIISFVGYEEYEIKLSFPRDNNKSFKIVLEKGEDLEEIIISTTRSSRTIEDIPTRIEAITGEELGEKAAMNSSNIGMLLQETTGVHIQQTSLSSGNMSIRIQGLDGRYTQILKDGFPLYGGFAGGLSIMQIPPLDLKQVELIKGGNSTLYGGGAIAGLVNLISIQPAEDPDLSVMLNQTSALGTTGNLFYAQKYGKLGLTIYGSASDQTAYDPDKDGFSNLPNANTYSLNPKVFYYINPNTDLNFGINTTFDKRTGGDMKALKEEENDQNIFSEENISERFATQIQLRNTNEKRTIVVKNSNSYIDRNLTTSDYRFNGRQISTFSEALYSLHKNENFDWQIGANHYLEKFTEENIDSLPLRDYSHNTIGAFVQNSSNIGSRFILEAGLRTDYNFDYGLFVLPRVALLYKATSKLTSRIGGALGYKLPSIFTEDAEKLYFQGIEPITAGSLKPETSISGNFDINYKTAFFNKMTFSINQLFFLAKLDETLVLREEKSLNRFYFENADGNILSTGFETNIKITYSHFKLYFNYALINTKLRYDNINQQKPLTPKHNAGFVISYEIEDKWSMGYELYYTGKQFDSSYDDKPEYWTMGVMIMRYLNQFSLFINFENFTNVIQSNYEPLVLPPANKPVFPDIWAPSDGFVFNGGIKFQIL